MRIILLSFLVLFNYSSLVTSCPSSGDGDCVPSTDTYNQGANQSSYQTVTEIPSMNMSSNYNIDESDSGLPDDYIAKSSSYLNEINKKSKLNAKIKRLNFDLKDIIYKLAEIKKIEKENLIIKKIGLQKGEKLFEELSIRKNFYKTKVKDIFSTKEPTYRNQDINNLLNKLKYNLYFKNQNYLKRQIFLFLNKEK